MPNHHLSDVDVNQSLGSDTLSNMYEMYTLGQSVNNHPYKINPSLHTIQLLNKLHGDLFPFPHMIG